MGLQSEAAKVRLAHDIIKTERIYESFKELLGEDIHITSNNKIFIFIFNSLIEPSDDLEEESYGFFYNDSTTGEPIIFISASQCQQENVLGATLAHELFHAFQTSFAKYSATWLEESTAVWAEDYINKTWNTEQVYIDDAFEYEMARSEPLETDSDEGVYGVYLFPYYLTNVNPKTDSVMRLIWENRGDGDSEIDAVQNAIGDFDDVWKKYSLATLDVEPEDGRVPDMVGRFGGDDPLSLFASHGTQTLVIENQGIAFPGLVDLEGIQTAYFEVKNKNQGADAPAIRFDLTPFQKHPDKVSVQAIIYYRDGRKEYEDWTGRDERLFCLGIDSQNFSVIYIAIGCSDSDLTLIEPLAITPEPTSRCYSGTVTLTRQREERDNFENNYRIGVFGTGNGSHHSSGNQSATLRLELDLSERILPQQEALLDQMQARAKDVKPDQMEAVRGFMENIMKTPQASLDKETGLMKVRYRVKTCRIDSAGGTYRSYNQYESADRNGTISEDEGSCNIQWSAKGLSAQTSEAIERGHIRVDIYYEPETGQIRWVYIPQLDIDTQVTENCNGQEIRRSGKGYESFPHSTNDSRDEVFQVTPSNGGNASEGLPMNVVWQAKQGNELTASGSERIETPIDRTWSSDGNSGTGEKMIIETFEWSINLTRAN